MNEYNKIGYSKDGINVIENLVSVKDLNKLNSFLTTIEKGGPVGKWEIEDVEIVELLNKYEDITSKEVSIFFETKFNVIIKDSPENPAHLVKWLPNPGFMPHSDSETRKREPAVQGGFYRYNITTIFYLTDQYNGGDIYFPDFDDYQPKIKAGTLIMFPSRYTHALKPLISGVRNTMPMWWTFDVEDDYKKQDHQYDGDISDVLFSM